MTETQRRQAVQDRIKVLEHLIKSYDRGMVTVAGFKATTDNRDKWVQELTILYMNT